MQVEHVIKDEILSEIVINEGMLRVYSSRENKELAFTKVEREKLGLFGRLPGVIMSVSEQVARAYRQYNRFDSFFEKNIYLRCLHDANEVVFYSLVRKHLIEMIPVIYTPTVGDVVQEFSLEFRKPRGLYIAYPDKDKMVEILRQSTNKDVDIIVVSDSQGVLGIGDQGVGGIEIPVAKLMVYTLCAGVSPKRHLPIVLDVGTDNKKLLEDPLYLGWRNKRISGDAYYEMMDLFIDAVREVFPEVFLHWEDFGRDNAIYNLEKYRTVLPSFNDDIQGTAAVTCSALIGACKVAKMKFSEQKIVFYGAGAAALGIADMIVQFMCKEGLTQEEAKARIWVLDSKGLLTSARDNLNAYKQSYMRDIDFDLDKYNINWKDNNIQSDLTNVVEYIKPTTLIGCSTDAGAFNANIIKMMADNNLNNCARPIIFPLSNPTKLAEAVPQDIIELTAGRALIATGSPFDSVEYQDKKI